MGKEWVEIKTLGEGGQGRVTLVRLEGQKDSLDGIIESIRLLERSSNSQVKKKAREDLGANLTEFIRDGPKVAAKKQILHPNEESISRLKREAEVYESISDPHLLKILDKDIPANWIVTEYQPNGTLEDQIKKYYGDAWSAIAAIRPLVSVLARLHDARFVHRDFKPSNIFVGRSGELVLGDAGLAFYKDDSQRVTQTYENVGTRDYMPAWAYSRRLKDINPTFDVFSLGKVLWAMIAGEPACPLWYVLKPENDLTTRFPDRIEMLWVNELFMKCVVQEENEMKTRNAGDLLKVIDAVLPAMQARGVPPTKVLQLRSCRVCFIGTYVEDNAGHRGSITYPTGHCFRCDRCGHLEFFMTSAMTKA